MEYITKLNEKKLINMLNMWRRKIYQSHYDFTKDQNDSQLAYAIAETLELLNIPYEEHFKKNNTVRICLRHSYYGIENIKTDVNNKSDYFVKGNTVTVNSFRAFIIAFNLYAEFEYNFRLALKNYKKVYSPINKLIFEKLNEIQKYLYRVNRQHDEKTSAELCLCTEVTLNYFNVEYNRKGYKRIILKQPYNGIKYINIDTRFLYKRINRQSIFVNNYMSFLILTGLLKPLLLLK
ncbi:MAG: hypothetical protein JWN78_2490 [Bacteroidota bacterium]|nr:hypothetical protein [Bacteroidota bacterium]